MTNWSRIEWAPFARAFLKPFITAGLEWKQRTGIILRATAASGQVCYGEAAPLPGFSRDSLAQITNVLREEDLNSFTEQGQALALPPSLQFAWESLSLVAPRTSSPVQSNAVFSMQEPIALAIACQESFQQGYRCFKIKIAPESWRGILPVLKEWSGRVQLRLDSNASFSLVELREASHELQSLQIEYWEDPLQNPLELPCELGIPFVLDSWVDSWTRAQEALSLEAYSGVIIKPTVVGGLTVTKHMVCAAEEKRKIWNITSALETEVARRALFGFLFSLGRTDKFYGLATGKLYSDNFFSDLPECFQVPSISQRESAWLSSLSWRELRS